MTFYIFPKAHEVIVDPSIEETNQEGGVDLAKNKFDRILDFIKNADNDAVIRCRSDSSSGKVLYVRNGNPLGQIFQEIFDWTSGAVKKRYETKNIINSIIKSLNINEEEKNLLTERINKIVKSRDLKKNDLAEIIQKFNFKPIENEESSSKTKPALGENGESSVKNEGEGLDISDLWIESEDSKNTISSSADSPEEKESTTTSLILSENSGESSVVIPGAPVVNKNNLSETGINPYSTSAKIPELSPENSQSFSLKEIDLSEKNNFGLFLIKEKLSLVTTTNSVNPGIIFSQAYVVPKSQEKINLLDKINGIGYPSVETEIDLSSSSPKNISAYEGTQRISGYKIPNPDSRKFYKIISEIPNFVFLVENDLSENELENYKKASSEYQENLCSIYRETFTQALELHQKKSGTPLKTITLVPLSQNPKKLLDIEAAAMAKSIQLFQQENPEIHIAVVVNGPVMKGKINEGFAPSAD